MYVLILHYKNVFLRKRINIATLYKSSFLEFYFIKNSKELGYYHCQMSWKNQLDHKCLPSCTWWCVVPFPPPSIPDFLLKECADILCIVCVCFSTPIYYHFNSGLYFSLSLPDVCFKICSVIWQPCLLVNASFIRIVAWQ